MDAACPDVVQQDQVQSVIKVLLIHADGIRQIMQRESAFERQSVSLKKVKNASGGIDSRQRLLLCETRDLVHADRDSFPVALSFIMIILFYGMAEGMAEVQEHPFASVKLVMLHDLTLDIYTTADDGGEFILKFIE